VGFVRRRITVLLSVVSVAIACGALAAPVGAAAAEKGAVSPPAAGATGTWGGAQPVLGIPGGNRGAGLSVVSCASPGNCSAGGNYQTGSDYDTLAYVVTETDGVWGKAQTVAGARADYNAYNYAEVTAMSCSSPGNCSAGGTYGAAAGGTNGYPDNAFVVDETDGVWGRAQEVQGEPAMSYESTIASVSCTSPGNCSAGGSYAGTSGAGAAFVVDETSGVWGAPQPIPGLAGLSTSTSPRSLVDSVSCSAPGDCSAGGAYGSVFTSSAFVAEETDGVWGDASQVPGIASLNTGDYAAVDSVSCTGAGDCAAGGSYVVGKPSALAGDSEPFVVDEQGGTWGDAREVPGLAVLNVGGHAQVNSVSCASTGNCAAGGVYAPNATAFGDPDSQAFVVNETNGTWAKAADIPGMSRSDASDSSLVTSVSCASVGDCSAGGAEDQSDSTNTSEAFVVDETDGAWGAVRRVPGLTGYAQVTSVSCAAAADCAAVGYDNFAATGADSDGFTVDKSVRQPTATVLTESAAKVPYGREQAERISVRVTAGAAGTPTGAVTVTSGPKTVCTVTLAVGQGACVLSAREFPAGQVQLGAAYGGSYTLGASSSTARFTVAKAGTSTGLKLSAAWLTYGHEQSEKLTVAVTASTLGTPGGRVTIKAGRAAVCVITLTAGKGWCRLGAKKLPVGTYTLTAAYQASTDYAGSASAKKTLTVGKRR